MGRPAGRKLWRDSAFLGVEYNSNYKNNSKKNSNTNSNHNNNCNVCSEFAVLDPGVQRITGWEGALNCKL